MGGRTYFRMARSLSQASKGFRSDNRQRRCLGVRCPHPNPHAATRKSLKSNAIIMSRTLTEQVEAQRVIQVNAEGEPYYSLTLLGSHYLPVELRLKRDKFRA